MADLPATIAAALAGRVVRKALLVKLDFASGPVRAWAGHGQLLADGDVWPGLGELGSISNIEMPMGGTAPETTLSLSGVDPSLVAVALGDSAEWKGRFVIISVQHFDEDWNRLDVPLALYTGLMDRMQISAAEATRRIDVTCEWLFARRAIPVFSELTDSDQQARHPGDKGLEFVPRMQNFVDPWPLR